MKLTREWLIENGISADLLDRLLADAPSATLTASLGGSGNPGGVIGRPTAGRRTRTKLAAEPITSEVVVASDGRWVCRVSGWRPASDNLRARGHWKWAKAKKADCLVIRDYVAPFVPKATGKRRVGLLVQKRRGPLGDGQNLLKSWLDAMVNNGLLIDDDGRRSQPTIPLVEIVSDLPCKVRSTIGIEDIES